MNCTFDSIAGYKAEKEELKRLCDVFSNREKYERKGAKMPKGIIFYGDAGTGKTLFTKVLANECNLHVIKIDISDMDIGTQICREIRRAFEKAAKQKEPSMIFFDELDKVLPNDSERYYTDQAKMVLAQLLTLIDGMNTTNKFIFVATCNYYGSLPETLVRPGRIDKKISISKPNYSSRVEILKMYAQKSSCSFEISMEELAKLCGGFTCSALETLINECVLQSDENDFVSKRLVTERILEIKSEDIPKPRSLMSDTINACRNLGYFVVAKTFNNGDYVLNLESENLGNNFFNRILSQYDDDYEEDDFYSYYDDDDCDEEDCDCESPIKEDMEIADYCEQNDTSLTLKAENKYYSKNDLLNTICVLCGGYAAEQVVLNSTFDNLFGDFQNVYSILLDMAQQGMFGIENIYTAWRNSKLNYTDDFINHMNNLFKQVIEERYDKAKSIICKNSEFIKSMIPILVERGNIDSKNSEPIIKRLGGIKK